MQFVFWYGTWFSEGLKTHFCHAVFGEKSHSLDKRQLNFCSKDYASQGDKYETAREEELSIMI